MNLTTQIGEILEINIISVPNKSISIKNNEF